MYLLGRGCICLSLSERTICPTLENTGCAQTAGKWEHEFSSNSEPPLESDTEVCSKPVATCHNPQNSRQAWRKKKKTKQRRKKKTPACQRLFSLSNCSAHIRRITGLILLYNHCSLFPLIVSLLNLFVCVHILATQMFFCHANRAICVQGN